jgi:hypothetical protein
MDIIGTVNGEGRKELITIKWRDTSAVSQTTESSPMLWIAIRAHAGEKFRTAAGLPLSYVVPCNYVRVVRDGRRINRSLTRTNFAKALSAVPAERPSDIKDRQVSGYTWAIL